MRNNASVIDPSCDSIAVLDEHGVIVSVNPVWQAFAGSNGGSAALASGVGIDYLGAVRRAAAGDSLAAAALQGSEDVLAGRQATFILEYPCHSPDCERWFELHATPLLGEVRGMVVGHRDITARKLALRALEQCTVELRHNERDLTALLNSVSSMIGYWDRNLRNRFANHAYRDWFGVDPAAIPGKHIREVIGEERFRLNRPYIEAALAGTAQQFERAIPSPDGRSVRYALARYTPDLVDGEVQGFFVEVVDVTSIKHSEQALQRAQQATQALLYENTRLVRQLLAVQERERTDLARELHDELSQHLTAIRAFAGAIQRDEAADRARSRAAAQAIEDCARAIYEVSHRLMEGLHPNILDAAGIVEAIATLLQTWQRQHPEIACRLSLDHQLVCDAAQVRVAVYRVVQECLSNVARHAHASRLRLLLARRQAADGERLLLIIRDDGVGMEVDAQHAGFGLLGMRERILSLGGSLKMSSVRGSGTRVRVILPNG
ncbi:MAG: PAS domain-containing protein [Candidatus Accumulibacter sp. UW26]